MGNIIRFIIEVETDESEEPLSDADANELLAEMEDLANRKGLSIYDQRIEREE